VFINRRNSYYNNLRKEYLYYTIKAVARKDSFNLKVKTNRLFIQKIGFYRVRNRIAIIKSSNGSDVSSENYLNFTINLLRLLN